MCGIVGFLDTQRRSDAGALTGVIRRMTSQLHHRGPDDGGEWVDAQAGLALGHRRLAILDLSAEGHQPMHSVRRRYVIAFNGEIYNFHEVRQALVDEDPSIAAGFRGSSDTEVMLAAFEQWGVEASVNRFNGMFAFAAWDRQERVLYLARDRMGEKPLYYGRMGNVWLFASELKALRSHPGFSAEINRDVLALYLRYGYIPAPYTIYKGIHKLPPGCIWRWQQGQRDDPAPSVYWSARTAAEAGLASPFRGSEEEAAEELESLLRDSVRLRMLADVPLGAFLSGGIDSSTVAALMQENSSRPVKTFTVGFHEADYNEAQHARAVAAHLGTEHLELYITPDQAIQAVPRLPALYDEPFSDSSQIPTYLISALTRGFVTVSLSGDGGDEVFGGYNRHSWGQSIWKNFGWMPPSLQTATRNAMLALPPRAWDRVFAALGPVLPRALRPRNPGDKLQKLAEILPATSPAAIYHGLVSLWKDPRSVVQGAVELPELYTIQEAGSTMADLMQKMMLLDTVTYLPDDILVKLDRASMGVSLEARVPLLDHRLVEFAWRLPASMKFRDGKSKWLLRQVLYKHVPRKLLERPKAGFAIPVHAWLRGPLREWAEGLLNENLIRRQGFFDPAPIRRSWAEHLSGRYNRFAPLWSVLMFQAWLHNESRLAAAA